MSVDPVFVPSLDALKSQLRINNAEEPQTEDVISRAVTQARVDLYHRLGESRVNEILATPSTSNPTTQAQLDRVRAELLERKMVRLTLLYELPVIWMDDQGATRTDWNEDGLTSNEDRAKLEIDRIKEEIEDDIADLLPNDPTEGNIQGGTVFPAQGTPLAGTSLGVYAGRNSPYGKGPCC